MKSLSLSKPHIIAMLGIPGSGKSHFAQKFSETFSAPFLCHHYLQHLSDDDEKVHAVALETLRELLKTGQTLVYEGSTESKENREELVKFAKRYKYTVIFVWVQTDPATAKKRMKDILTSDMFQQKTQDFEPPHEKESFVVISGRHTYATQARTLLKRLTEDARPQTITKQPRVATPTVPPRASNGRVQIL